MRSFFSLHGKGIKKVFHFILLAFAQAPVEGTPRGDRHGGGRNRKKRKRRRKRRGRRREGRERREGRTPEGTGKKGERKGRRIGDPPWQSPVGVPSCAHIVAFFVFVVCYVLFMRMCAFWLVWFSLVRYVCFGWFGYVRVLVGSLCVFGLV